MGSIAVSLALLFAAQEATPVSDAALKAAVEKAIARVQTGIVNYPKHRQCFSCHHHAVGVMSLTAAKQRGFTIDEKVVKDAVDFSLRSFRNRDAIAKGRGVGGDSTGVGYILHTLSAVEHAPNATTAALVEYLLVKQQKDGTWPIALRGDRPPTMGSLFTNVGLGVAGLRAFEPPEDAPDANELRTRIDAAVARARDWLIANKPVSTEDAVFRLRGLVDASADAKRVAAARDDLLARQRQDGSWSQLPPMTGDAYATATALAALRHSGLEATHAAYRRGVKYLLRAQDETGAWFVKTRSNPLQVYFDNGDLGGRSQFISFAATNWAILALVEALPAPDEAWKPKR
jgi:N-acyl-D-amino-acid deacylase